MVGNYIIHLIMMGNDVSTVVVEKAKGRSLFWGLLYTPIVGIIITLPIVMLDGTRVALGAFPFIYIVCLFRYACAKDQKSPYRVEVGEHFTTIDYSWFFWDRHIVLDNSKIEIRIRMNKPSVKIAIVPTKGGFFQKIKETFFIYTKKDNWSNTEILKLIEIFRNHSVKMIWSPEI